MTFEGFVPESRCDDVDASTTPFEETYACLDSGAFNNNNDPYRFNQGDTQGTLDVPPQPPTPDGGDASRRNFQVHRGTDNQVNRIDLQGGLQMRRNGNDWQLMRGEQPVTGEELQRFASQNPLGIPLAVRDGKIQGRFNQRDNGDVTYDARGTEINTFATIKADGSRDIRNFNDYSRRVVRNGQPEDKTYWDGWNWRHGTEQRRPDGNLQITYDPREQRPANSNTPWPPSTVRDARNDRLIVQHSETHTQTASWREQRLETRNGQQQTVQYFDGQNWRQGRPAENGPNGPGQVNYGDDARHMRRIEFSDSNTNGPGAIVIDTRTGEIKERIPRGPVQQPRSRPTITPTPQPRI